MTNLPKTTLTSYDKPIITFNLPIKGLTPAQQARARCSRALARKRGAHLTSCFLQHPSHRAIADNLPPARAEFPFFNFNRTEEGAPHRSYRGLKQCSKWVFYLARLHSVVTMIHGWQI